MVDAIPRFYRSDRAARGPGVFVIDSWAAPSAPPPEPLRSWHKLCKSWQGMISVDANSHSLKTRTRRPALEIRFHLADGSSEAFIQSDTEAAEAIQGRINPYLMFIQPRIVIADDYSKSVFICSQINRVDILYDGDGYAHIPGDHLDLVELTAAEFRKHVPLKRARRLEKRKQRRRVGDLLVSFLNLRMRGGHHVYLMNEILVKPSFDSNTYMQRFLSKGTLGVRLPGGGESFLNLANLISYSVYPGVPEVPADTWMALPKLPDQ